MQKKKKATKRMRIKFDKKKKNQIQKTKKQQGVE